VIDGVLGDHFLRVVDRAEGGQVGELAVVAIVEIADDPEAELARITAEVEVVMDTNARS